MAARPHQHLLAIPGVGVLTAAKILGETHDVRPLPIRGSLRRPRRHRAHPRLERQHQPPSPRPWRQPPAQPALFTVSMVQARWHPDARTYLARKRAEGKTGPEARRCLKRHLAATIYRAMIKDSHILPDPTPAAASRERRLRDALIRLVGAGLAEQHDEWAEGRRYLGLEVLARARITAVPDSSTPAEEVAAIPTLSA